VSVIMMEFKTKTVEIRGLTFEVRELTIRDMIPLLKTLEDEPVAGQAEMMRRSLYIDGAPIGEKYDELPASMMMKLVPVVMEVNNLGGGDDEGKEGEVGTI